jgi:hypothetical protein
MSIATLILGESGTGKSTSMRNLNPADTLLIQVLAKPLPFKAKGWKPATKDNPTGSIFVTDQTDTIIKAMKKTTKKIIVIDDWNLTMTNEYMRRSTENGFQKFADIGHAAWELMMTAAALPPDVRVYLLGHSELSDQGHTKAKTIGKMIDQTCPVESMFSIVLRAALFNSQYIFYTQNNGQDTCKSPMQLFDSTEIPNDLNFIDQRICEYYEIGVPAQ